MDDVRGELDRLRRGWGTARARDLAGRTHLVILGAAFVAAFGSRVLGPWPVIGALEGRWLAVGGALVGLVLLRPAIALLLPHVLRVPRVVLARRLDDAMAWGDAADTALGIPGGGSHPVEAFLATQTAGRLRGLETDRLWPRGLSGRWPRRILLLLFAAVLLLPGVLGLFGERGAGRGDDPGLGSSPEVARPTEAIDADAWQRDHMRLFLRADAPKEKPLEARVRWMTDEPLPADYAGDLVLLWDGEGVRLGSLEGREGDEVDRTVELDLAQVEALAELLTPGRHVAQCVLTPREDPWGSPLESNRLEVVLEEGGDGGQDGESEQEEPAPRPEGRPEEQPEPQPEPPPPSPPPPTPEGPEETPAPPPPGQGPDEVVDPFVRHGDETVHKEEAVVAVPDPEAGLEPPPQVPLSEAMQAFEKIVERAMADERVRGRDREFLLRYFRALRKGSGAAKEPETEKEGGEPR